VPPYRPATASATTQEEINCEEVLLLPNIQYHDNTARFKGEIAAKQTLFAIFDYMKAHPSTTLTLYGHTDVFGEEERNLELSKERVVGIQRWLSSKGIQASRIQYEWFGSLHPLHPAGSLENRRVEIKLTCTP
jgi:outer membrane protein OmpA-like peptidoglycan-associated protein